MSIERWEMEMLRRGNPEAAAAGRKLIEKWGDVPLQDPEDPLLAKWNEQVASYVDLGFHDILGMTKAEYVASLPHFEPKPSGFFERVEQPLLVETRIPLEKLLTELFRSGLKAEEVRDWPDFAAAIPSSPYTVWSESRGGTYHWNSASEARHTMVHDERGGTLLEGIAFSIHYPRRFPRMDKLSYSSENVRFMGMPGSTLSESSAIDASVPVIGKNRHGNMIVSSKHGRDRMSRMLVCAKV